MTMRNRRIAVSARRRTVWARNFDVRLNTAGAAIDLLAPYRAELGMIKGLGGYTITRIVGTHDLRVVSADDAFTRWVWGLRLAAIDDPPTNAQHPLASPGLDWMYVRQDAIVQTQVAGTPVVKPREAHLEVDQRAQRKITGDGMSLWYIGDNIDGDNFDLLFNFNILLKVP